MHTHRTTIRQTELEPIKIIIGVRCFWLLILHLSSSGVLLFASDFCLGFPSDSFATKRVAKKKNPVPYSTRPSVDQRTVMTYLKGHQPLIPLFFCLGNKAPSPCFAWFYCKAVIVVLSLIFPNKLTLRHSVSAAAAAAVSVTIRVMNYHNSNSVPLARSVLNLRH